MTPAPPLTSEQHQRLSSALTPTEDPGWSSVELTIVCVGPETLYDHVIRVSDEHVINCFRPLPRAVTDPIQELRQQTYRPGTGTWFTARVTLEAGGRLDVDLDFDSPPPLTPAPTSWAEDLKRFPRDPQHVPLWLQQQAAGPPEWLGTRWELDLRPADAPAVPATAIDATTTPEAQDWARAILAQLRAHGITARISQDEGEDGQGNPTTYDELLITVGEGHMALAFWRGLLAWFVDVFPDQCDQATVTHVARTTLAAAQEVSGYTLDLGPLTPTDRALLGVAAQ